MKKRECISCDQKTTKFYGEGYKECSDCHSKRVQDNRQVRGINNIKTLLELGFINNSEISAALKLYLSCESRINACVYNQGIYRDVEVDWDNPLEFTIDIIKKLPDMWQDWKVQNAIYEESGKETQRPNIDRIDETGNYTLSNIQTLSKYNNVKKASAKPCKILIIKDGVMKGVFEYESKKQMQEILSKQGIPKLAQVKMNNAEIQKVGKGYAVILQSKDDSKVQPSDTANYELVIDHKRYEVDEKGNIMKQIDHFQYDFKNVYFKI